MSAPALRERIRRLDREIAELALRLHDRQSDRIDLMVRLEQAQAEASPPDMQPPASPSKAVLAHAKRKVRRNTKLIKVLEFVRDRGGRVSSDSLSEAIGRDYVIHHVLPDMRKGTLKELIEDEREIVLSSEGVAYLAAAAKLPPYSGKIRVSGKSEPS